MLAVERRAVVVEGDLSPGRRRRQPFAVRGVHGHALLAPGDVAVHDGIDELRERQGDGRTAALHDDQLQRAVGENGIALVRRQQGLFHSRAEPPRAYATHMTVMRRLDDEGLLDRRRSGRQDIYAAALTHEQYRDRRDRRDRRGLLPAVPMRSSTRRPESRSRDELRMPHMRSSTRPEKSRATVDLCTLQTDSRRLIRRRRQAPPTPPLDPERAAVLAGVGAAEQRAVPEEDRLAATER